MALKGPHHYGGAPFLMPSYSGGDQLGVNTGRGVFLLV